MRKILMTTALGLTLSVSAGASFLREEGNIKVGGENAFSCYIKDEELKHRNIKCQIELLDEEIEKEEKKNERLSKLKKQRDIFSYYKTSKQDKEDRKNFDTFVLGSFPNILKSLKETKIIDLTLVGGYGLTQNNNWGNRTLTDLELNNNTPLVCFLSYITNSEKNAFDMGDTNPYLKWSTQFWSQNQNITQNVGTYLAGKILEALDSKTYTETKHLKGLGNDLNFFMKNTCKQYRELELKLSFLELSLQRDLELDLSLQNQLNNAYNQKNIFEKKDKNEELIILEEKKEKKDEVIDFDVTEKTMLRFQILEETKAAFETLKPIYDLVLEVIDLIKRSGKVS
jgi:hypothetical protein